jgi:hypothetical protein
MARRRTIQELRAAYDAETNGVRRERLIAEALAMARTARTRYGSETVRHLFPQPEIIAAVDQIWGPKLTAMETFESYLEALEDWLEALPTSDLYLYPLALYPSRISRAVRSWADGTGPTSPDRARNLIIEAQRQILPTA